MGFSGAQLLHHQKSVGKKRYCPDAAKRDARRKYKVIGKQGVLPSKKFLEQKLNDAPALSQAVKNREGFKE